MKNHSFRLLSKVPCDARVPQESECLFQDRLHRTVRPVQRTAFVSYPRNDRISSLYPDHADISRTYPVDGVFSDIHKKIYQAVLNTNKEVIKMIKPGLSIPELQEFTFEFLKNEAVRAGLIKEDEDIKKYYIHNVSHFLGLDTHDVGDRSLPLEAGNVITVEPGLYFVDLGIGVRIEDDVLVTEEGSKCLSDGIGKEIYEVERLLKSKKAER